MSKKKIFTYEMYIEAIAIGFKEYIYAKQKLKASWDIVVNQLIPKWIKRIKFELETIGDMGVTAFYDSYAPYLYKRIEDLFNAYRIMDGGDDIIPYISMGSEYMQGGHKIDNDYIYINSFQEGYHGGAIDGPGHPSPGTPWWRTGPTPYSFVEWGRPATRGPKPEEKISKEAEEYLREAESQMADEIRKFIIPRLQETVDKKRQLKILINRGGDFVG